MRPASQPATPAPVPAPSLSRTGRSVLVLPLTLILVLTGMSALPLVRSNPRLFWSFLSAAAFLAVWLGFLTRSLTQGRRAIGWDFVPVKSHYIQAMMHFSIYSYWGYYWRKVYGEAPLILAQIVFLYTVDMLLCWSRRDRWRLGFGNIPIVFSTNLFLWFKDDWFYLQFLMILTGALGKEFVKWKRDGRLTHIFNPSAFSLSLFSTGLILTNSTQISWGEEVATTMGRAPHMFLWIFCVGLIVQFFFSVTLMTLGAAAALYVLNLIYTHYTGVYFFIDSNIPIAVFLGLHLLMTDPSTSPRSGIGRLIFGLAYGVLVWALYWGLNLVGVPEFYDKLLCVPLLNLSVQWIDRMVRAGGGAKLEAAFMNWSTRKLNFAHMGVWIALFTTMLFTGFVGQSHAGSHSEFWRKALAEGRRKAGEKLFRVLGYQVDGGSASAANELGVLFMEGRVVPMNTKTAAELFQRSSEAGNIGGACNLLNLAHYYHMGDPAAVARALDRIEAAAGSDTNGQASFFLGMAYANGEGRIRDSQKALAAYTRACDLGWRDGCVQVAKLRMFGDGIPIDTAATVAALEKAYRAGDLMSAYFLANLLRTGNGVAKDEARAVELLKKACDGGVKEACQQLQSAGR